jgi:hypothetical protein
MAVLLGSVEGASRRKKLKSIEVWGKKWFQKTYGNTYHKVRVYVNGELLGTSSINYGYGDSYLQTAEELLRKHGYLKNKPVMDSLWRYCKEKGINLKYYAEDVKTERELKNF